ncbi:hypothetical protein D8B46_05445 [Candidatus Gracilibacteria bacterium]|nr:MAG: hypothetical protein D8B46_05445 [Candidatus Gracilibacteria bacterium]
MFDISVIDVDNQKDNIIIKKSVNLDKNLDCFLMISSSDKNLAENLLNIALESIIDKISKEETYNDFGIALENINSFLKNWKSSGEQEDDEVDMSISVLNENNLMFSNIGRSTVYLINKDSEIIELTERNENKKSFLFISNGILANGEIIISSTVNILKYLSKSDIMDGMILSNDIEIFNKNIKNILQSEIMERNCIISSLKYKNEFIVEENPKINAVKDFAIKILDTNFSKKMIGGVLIIKDKISNQNKFVKNTIFFVLIAGLILLLFFLVSGIWGQMTKTTEKEVAKDQILELQNIISEATSNISNPGIFNRNIQKAEDLIKTLDEKKLYTLDLETAKKDINILKKQFNKIEIFNAGQDNLVYAEASESNVKVLKDTGKTYIVTKKGIIGPIVSNVKPKTYIFNSLSDNEEFVDGGILGQDVYLVTNTSKVVKFNRNGNFSFANVSGQQSWETIKSVGSYSSSLYTLSNENQIHKHPVISTGFGRGNTYLKEEDRKNLGNVISMAIDGGFYLVKSDLSVVKFFSNPYRLESLTVSKIPENYNLEEGKRFEVKAGIKLNYVYMLLNDKIFVFKPNTTDFKSTRNLTYVGQIEGGNEKIIDFNVDSDGEITVLNSKGLYRLKFEVSDDKLILR